MKTHWGVEVKNMNLIEYLYKLYITDCHFVRDSEYIVCMYFRPLL